MTTHILSMTYPPKIEAVRRLECRRTTRLFNPENPFEEGDSVLIHGWAGKPYRSPWNWRLPKMPILPPIYLLAMEHTIGCWQNPITGTPLSRESVNISYVPWQDPLVDELARLDGIDPPTGLEYKSVLERFHGRFVGEPVQFQIVRW